MRILIFASVLGILVSIAVLISVIIKSTKNSQAGNPRDKDRN